MRNRFIDGVRQDKWTVQDVDGQSAAKLSTNPAQQWGLYYSDVLREIDRLSPATREAVALCWFAGLSHQDAAKILGWPLGTLKARVRRAREALSQTL
jgi:DNA-directed RNA polymerase specialized sigma24 family protein